MRQITHLGEEVYADPKNIIAATFSLRRRSTALQDSIAEKASDILKSYWKKHNIRAYGWLIMPDRIHIVVSPTNEKSVVAMIQDLQKALEKDVLPRYAQFYEDFFDHVLRKAENPRAYVQELFERPVRLSLCKTAQEYRFRGSTEHEDLNPGTTIQIQEIEEMRA